MAIGSPRQYLLRGDTPHT
ncbi:hypothetical protein DVU_3325 [Nitratidesulfovibrio vulgaris str. Hildenborough]|uniref:Uncharacterized protein n=1 Tax=Nitratidesulfovibrio vulgaris (strain ATCC 29579 / DSM 644 / CCUG 34227 / NCIMB 8303 / VKM B-1760 / Hildenborough) TaxID=882 RepID=Q725V0_NITV2|nr:hypothetical protein DVU_3325 [Nitratidesulfovibrio vulgaris str. Hildenborough]